MEQKHTPTPWASRADGCLMWGPQDVPLPPFIKINSPWRENAMDENEQARANAAFIVRAVNSHAALVEALGALAMAARLQIDACNNEVDRLPPHDPNRSGPEAKANRWRILHDRAATAIQLAKGEA